MIGKMRSGIEKITLDTATFKNVVVEPTFINFFYGNNGTGKTTIAESIEKRAGLTWQEPKTDTDYNILVYNQDFVDANLASYGNLKGVFTIGEDSIAIQKEIEEMNKERLVAKKIVDDDAAELGRKDEALKTLLNSLQDNCFSKTKAIRERFDETQAGNKRKAAFTETAIKVANPTQHDVKALEVLYDTAFDTSTREYPEFKVLGGITQLKGFNVSEILSTPIISRSDSPFSKFMKALNATDWVRQGLNRFSETDGRCPYCQQPLPDEFEDEIAAIFDEQYQKSIDELNALLVAYETDMRGFVGALRANKSDVFSKLDLTEYDDKLSILEKTVESNIQLIISKTKEPSLEVELDGIKTIRDEINTIIAELNKQIKEHNDVVNARNKNKSECKTKVWELIAFMLQTEIASYNSSHAALTKEISTLQTKNSKDRASLKDIETEIADKSKSVRSTKPTIDNINSLLKDSGFQGFILREKQGHKNVYEVVRENTNHPVERLSDGEKNFIAFLYFYQLVKGSHSDNETITDKIVVIDDPVSSLDSSVMFIVSTLVREMVEVCFNNTDYSGNKSLGDYIKQIFLMTHNVYFHREVTYNQAQHYKSVSFFVVNKANNLSGVRPCIRTNPAIPTEQENYNPVKNSYAALWSELKELDTSVTVLNVIRRIMEYYFMQLCGYDGNNIRNRILNENKDLFVVENEDGSSDYSKYHLASAMLSYIANSTTGITDGLNLVDEFADVDLCKDVFKMIFETLGQEQHYKMMTAGL